MKIKVKSHVFIDAMIRLGWSYDGAEILFKYLEELEEDIGQEIDFDPISFNADYIEMTISEAFEEYNSESIEDLLETLEHDTIVVWYDDDIIIFGNY